MLYYLIETGSFKRRGQEDDQRRAASAGFDRHLTKPVNPSEVLALLSREKVASTTRA